MSPELLSGASGAGTALSLAFSFNVFAAAAGSAVAAGVLGTGRGWRRWVFAACAVAAAWIIGDGYLVLVALERLGGAAQPRESAMLAAWAVGGLLSGYTLPAWAGAYAGRQVTVGSGWLTSMSIAASVAVALSTLGGAVR